MGILANLFSKKTGRKVASLLAVTAMVPAVAQEAVAEATIKLSEPIVWSVGPYTGQELDSQAGLATVTGVSVNSPFFDPSFYMDPNPTQSGSFDLIMGGAFARGAWGAYGVGAQSYASLNREAYGTASINSGIDWDSGSVYAVNLGPGQSFMADIITTQSAQHTCTANVCNAESLISVGVYSATANELVYASGEALSRMKNGQVINSFGDMSSVSAYNATEINQLVYVFINAGTQAVVPGNAVWNGQSISQPGQLPDFTSPVPEVPTGVLLTLGLAGLAVAGRRGLGATPDRNGRLPAPGRDAA